MNILVVDDSIDKLGEIAKCILKINNKIRINTVQDIHGTFKFLSQNYIDLLIVDLFLPERISDNKIKKTGGEEIIREISRYSKKLNAPKYIVAVTQQEEINASLINDIWPIIKYKINNNWDVKLSKIISHIDHIVNLDQEVIVKPTVYVEGVTDEIYLKMALAIFYPEYINQIDIKSQSNAGANWVAQQLIIWGHQLPKKEGNLIPCIGLLDNDDAGNLAKDNIHLKITTSNQKLSCKVLQILPNYNKSIIDFYSKRIKIQVEIESLFPPNILQYAADKNWLEMRNQPLLETPVDWNLMTQNLNDFILNKGVNTDNLIYLNQVKLTKKEVFSKYITKTYPDDNIVFQNFKLLLADILKKLNIIKE